MCARCNAMERPKLQEALLEVADNTLIPWIIGSDFNVILSEEEKLRVLLFNLRDSWEFANCISQCGVTKLPTQRSQFTWWNCRIENECIFEALDRILVNQEFLDIFLLLYFIILLDRALIMLPSLSSATPKLRSIRNLLGFYLSN